MAGALATVSFLPTTVPLIWQIIRFEETAGMGQASAVALSVHAALMTGRPADAVHLPYSTEVASISVRTEGPEFESWLGPLLPQSQITKACAQADPVVVQQEGRKEWALSCVVDNDITVVVAVGLDPAPPAQQVMLLVLSLGLSVGIITALGILRLLRPLSEISGALARVGGRRARGAHVVDRARGTR